MGTRLAMSLNMAARISTFVVSLNAPSCEFRFGNRVGSIRLGRSGILLVTVVEQQESRLVASPKSTFARSFETQHP